MFAGRTEPSEASYRKFVKNLNEGRAILTQAVDVDSKFKNTNSTEGKLKAAELYKAGRGFFRIADEVNIMDIPSEKRKEVRELREKMHNFDKSAQDRILAICDEISPSRGASTSSTAREIREKSPTFRQPVRPVVRSTLPPAAQGQTRARLLKGVDSKIGERLLDEILDRTGVTLDDVAGCDSAKKALEEAVILPALNPALFSGLRQPVKGILLFGPPGNGKTLLAKAVAGESGQTFFNISASSLTSKWVGETEKTIRSLFQIARNAQPAIIFIDEIDSMLCERNEKDSEVSRRLKTEFLVQFDGATSSIEDRILVIGATNRPYELDDAVLRRFPKRILLGLPDERARSQLIESTLRRHNMLKGLSSSDIRYVASRTKYYSNSDLVNLCKEAAMVPIRTLDKRQLAKADNAQIRQLRTSDFDEAMSAVKPSTSDKVMEKLVEFAKRAGQS